MVEIKHKILPHLGFAGVGWIGKKRLDHLMDNRLLNRICLFDPNPLHINDILQESSDATKHERFEDLLHERVKGVVIATPSALHADQAIRALENGKAVFCQKPLGINLAQTKEVVEAARRNNRLLAVDYSYRYTKGIRALQKMVDRKLFGEIYRVEAMFHNSYGPDKDWFYDPNLSGGGCLMDLGTHLVDLVHYLFPGMELSVAYAKLLSNGQKYEKNRTEDYAEAILESDKNLHVHLACSWKMAAGKDADIQFRITGTQGAACFYNVNGSFYDFNLDVYSQRHTENLVAPPDDWGGKAIQRWVERLALDNSYDEDNEELVRLARTIEDIYLKAMS